MCLRNIAALGILILTISACVWNSPASARNLEDKAAVAHVLAQASKVRTLTLDLSDPKVSHFLKRHYEISGIVGDRYPGFHQLLVEQAGKMAKTGVSGPKVTILSDDLQYEDLATLMLGLYTTGNGNYTGAAVASMEAAAADTRSLQISYSSLCFYDLNQQPIGSCVTNKSFGAGQYFPVSNVLNASNQSFTAAFTATYYDVTNQRFVAQISTLSSDAIAAPAQQQIAAPVIVNSNNVPLATALVCTSRKVNANANPGSCDYGTYASTDVLMDMNGSVTYKSNQNPKTDPTTGKPLGFAAISLINLDQGGQCTTSPSIAGENFFQQPQVTYKVATKILNWNFTKLDFGAAGGVICGGPGTNIQFSLLVSVNDTANAGNPIVAAQYSVAGTTTPHFIGIDAGALATPMLRLVAGCLHPDTQIVLGDGSVAPITRLKGEGELIRGASGQRHVIGTTVGDDSELLIILAANGLSVKATAMHPFVLESGQYRAARDLRPGDRVVTKKGVAAIGRVSKMAYRGKVYNLLIERAAHEPVSAATESFFADGFLVGGHDAQQQLAQTAHAHPQRVEALLPTQFSKDYQSHLEDRANARR